MSTQPATTQKTTGPKKAAAPKVASKEAKAAAVAKARNDVHAELHAEHREEINRRIQAKLKAQGIEWSPKPTAEEKALAEAKLLLEQFPHLIEKLVPQAQVEHWVDDPASTTTSA